MYSTRTFCMSLFFLWELQCLHDKFTIDDEKLFRQIKIAINAIFPSWKKSIYRLSVFIIGFFQLKPECSVKDI